MEKYCPECGTEYPGDQERCERDGRRLIPIVSDDLWVGRELDGRYHVRRVLGKGGMGTVFEVEQSLLGRRLALKLLRRELGQDKASVMRFFAEAKALASLRSPHTVTLHDFGSTEDGQLFFTMDLLEGAALSDLLAREGRLSYARACSLVLQVLDSLEEAHDRNILHRDLKPENVFVTQVKGREFAVVLDFGIAKLVGDPNHEGVTNTGLICGTPAYMSPEQALGNPAVKSSDLYSLAVMLYEMLSGQLPFPGTTALRLAMSHISELPAPITQRAAGADIPKPLEGFLERALEKEATMRFPDAAAFRAALLQAMFQCADAETQAKRVAEVEEVLQASSSDWSASSWAELQRLAVPKPHKRRQSTTRWKGLAIFSATGLVLAVAIAVAGWMPDDVAPEDPGMKLEAKAEGDVGIPPNPQANPMAASSALQGAALLESSGSPRGAAESPVAVVALPSSDSRLPSGADNPGEPNGKQSSGAVGGAATAGATVPSGGATVPSGPSPAIPARRDHAAGVAGATAGPGLSVVVLTPETRAILEAGQRAAASSSRADSPIAEGGVAPAPATLRQQGSRRSLGETALVGGQKESKAAGRGGADPAASQAGENGSPNGLVSGAVPATGPAECKGTDCPKGSAGEDSLDFRPVKTKADPTKLGTSGTEEP